MSIDVTQEDIDNGTKGGCYDCPIALAIERCVNPKAHQVHVMHGYVSFLSFANDSLDRKRKLPERARDFIDSFDSADPVEPFRFRLNVPAEVLKGAGE